MVLIILFFICVFFLAITDKSLNKFWDKISDDRYNLSKRYKWFDWIDDNIIWYIYDKPKTWYKEIRGYIYYNWNKETWELIKTAITVWPFDNCYQYELELAFLKKQYAYFKKTHFLIDEAYEARLRWIKYAIYMLEIITEHIDIDIWSDTDNQFKCIKYVNTKNKSRYKIECWDTYYKTVTMSDKCYDVNISELYKNKALYLYHKIRYCKSYNWWD